MTSAGFANWNSARIAVLALLAVYACPPVIISAEQHFDECHPCLEKYGLEQAVKKLVKRCCGSDDVPTDLRSKVMMRIELIRSGEQAPDSPQSVTPTEAPSA